jgi:hypothetical protein
LEGIPSNELIFKPSLQKGFLPTNWYKNQLFGRGSFRQNGIKTSLPEGTPLDKLIFIPVCQEGFLPGAGFQTSLPEGDSSGKLVFIPVCRKEPLPTSWFENQLAGRGSSQLTSASLGQGGLKKKRTNGAVP